MRDDMPKLLVERPRWGRKFGNRGRVRMRGVRDFDDLPKRVSIARDGKKSKSLNENLAPLERLLERRVGRPWDRVYSEIREHVRFEDPIQLHVLQHLWQYVERHVVMVEGVPHHATSGRELSGYRRSFYVCPSTGFLRRVVWSPGTAAKRKRKRNGSRR